MRGELGWVMDCNGGRRKIASVLIGFNLNELEFSQAWYNMHNKNRHNNYEHIH